MNLLPFSYAFQITPYVILEVGYFAKDNYNPTLLFIEPSEFVKDRSELCCGPYKSELLTGIAKDFWDKWSYLRHKEITSEIQYEELMDNINQLKFNYNYYGDDWSEEPHRFSFEGLKVLSSKKLKGEDFSGQRYEAILGPNTKQFWLYDAVNDTYIDPPKDVLDEIEEIRWANGEETAESISEAEARLEELASKNPEWLHDGYEVQAENYDI